MSLVGAKLFFTHRNVENTCESNTIKNSQRRCYVVYAKASGNRQMLLNTSRAFVLFAVEYRCLV